MLPYVFKRFSRALRLATQLLLLVLAAECAFADQAPASTPAPLTNIDQIHRLGPEQAARRLPVEIQGIVTSLPAFRGTLFLADPGDPRAAIDVHGLKIPVQLGDRVQITGTTLPGMFASDVLAKAGRVLSHGALPPAPLVTFGDIFGGSYDSRRVAVRAVVQSAEARGYDGSHPLRLVANMGGNLIEVDVLRFHPEDAAKLVDADVQIQGICATRFNTYRQFGGVRMQVDDMAEITIVKPAPAEPWAHAAGPVLSVLRFDSPPDAAHRVHLAGVVTYSTPSTTYLQDETGGIRVQTVMPGPVFPVGTPVEVLGFPALTSHNPALERAVMRRLPPTALPPVEPASIRVADLAQTSDGATNYPYEAHLVRFAANMVQQDISEDYNSLALHEGSSVIYASWPEHHAPQHAPAAGSRVLLTGVVEGHIGAAGQPAYRVLLRDPSDIVVIQPAPWWRPEHLLWLMGALLALAGISSLWVMMLRHRVQTQTQMLRQSEQRFRFQAQRDALTGLASRAYLQEQLLIAVGRAKNNDSLLGVIMVDLDHFKAVNDTLGHHIGDELLRAAAGRLREAVRHTDLVARMGGDEFIVLLPELAERPDAELVGCKIRRVYLPRWRHDGGNPAPECRCRHVPIQDWRKKQLLGLPGAGSRRS